MNPDYKVQILLASYNGANYIAEQIESILRQDHPGIVITVRDDGSTDRTGEIIREFTRKYPDKVVFLQDNGDRGLGAQGNFGKLLEAVDGDYFMFCDQDDVWFEDKVSRSLAALVPMENQFGAGVPLLVFSDLQVTDESLNVIHPSFWKLRNLDPDNAFDYEKLLANNIISGCTILFNSAARKAVMPIPPRHFLHDQWIGFHVAYYGRLSYLREPTLRYRQHGSNEMGAGTLKADYFLRKVFFFPKLWSDWRWLQRQHTIPFRLWRVVLLKLGFNVRRLIKSLKIKR